MIGALRPKLLESDFFHMHQIICIPKNGILVLKKRDINFGFEKTGLKFWF